MCWIYNTNSLYYASWEYSNKVKGGSINSNWIFLHPRWVSIVDIFWYKFFKLRLTVCLLAYIFMPSLVSGNWRAVLAWASLPAGIVFVITLIFIYESPRFLLLKDKSDKAMEVMIKIASKNRTSRDLHSIPIETY